MSSINILIVVAVGFISFEFCSNLRVIPEWVTIDAFDKKYIHNMSASIKRYSRRGVYYINGDVSVKQSWGDNVSMHVVFFEFLHNEYRRSFIEFHFKKFCEMMKTDPYIGKSFKITAERHGLSCPMPAGRLVIKNLTLITDQFPYLWPFQKAKAVTTIMFENKFVLNTSLYLRFEQKRAN